MKWLEGREKGRKGDERGREKLKYISKYKERRDREVRQG